MRSKYFTGQNKYFTFAGLSILLLVLVGLLSPYVIRESAEGQKDEEEAYIRETAHEVREIFKKRMEDIPPLIKKARQELVKQKGGLEEYFDVLQNSVGKKNEELNLLYENGGIAAWTNRSLVNGSDNFIEAYKPGEIFFIEKDLRVFLSSYDTLTIEGDRYFLAAGLLIQKNYSLNNRFFEEISFTEELNEKFRTSFEINFSPEDIKEKQGFRKHSFEITNSAGKTIAAVTFDIPSSSGEVERLKEVFSSAQAFLVILAFLLFSIGFFFDFRHISRRSVKFIVVILFLSALRILLFVFNIPGRFIEGGVADPSAFSTVFGYGIVKSPLELFITLLFFTPVFFAAYYLFIDYASHKREENTRLSRFFIALALIIPAFMISFRGFAAAIRSVIFDSSLRYFKEVILIPDLPVTVMHLNVLILGFCAVIGSVVYVSLVLVQLPARNKKTLLSASALIFILFQVSGLLYDQTHVHVEGTILIRAIFIIIVFILSIFLILYSHRTKLFFLYFLVTASVISVSLLNYYNSELERESIKTTALELTRPGESLLEFIVSDAASSTAASEKAKEAFLTGDVNYKQEAFRFWSKSMLQREDFSSEISFLDSNMNRLGGFSLLFDDYFVKNWKEYQREINRTEILKESVIFNDNKIIRAISPVINEGNKLGYIEVSALYDANTFRFMDVPEFISVRKENINPTVDFDKLKIFDFHNGELVNMFGDFFLTPSEAEMLTAGGFSGLNEKWLRVPLNKEDFLIYVINIQKEGLNRVVAVALKEKDISWSLFDFFRVFFLHSIFILGILVVYLLLDLGTKRQFNLTLRTQLLAAFLVISIIPLLLLAVYLRGLTEDKNTDAIYYKLGKRAVSVEQYINDYLPVTTLDDEALLSRAERDLGISFSLYSADSLVYSSQRSYYDIGLIPEILPPDVYENLYLNELKEYVAEEKIENYTTSSLFYRADLGGHDYIVKIDQAFNPILLPFAGIEVDIFLFGSYSLAVVFIIIIATILANQISSPVRKLTTATRAVAGGDLGIEVEEKYYGEVGELVTGFNSMIKQLKKSQTELAELERELAWKEMARQVAHEIKNPLTPMKLSIQQLSAAYNDNSPKFPQYFEKITRTVINQIETLRNIANEFSAFARMPGLKLEKFDIIPSLRESVNLFAEEPVEVELKSEDIKLEVESDKDQTQRTLINLLRNSVQAGADKIIVSVLSEGGECIIRVKDNGKGIPPEIVERIFDDNFTTKLRGMGIGLSMAKRFMESLHGSISVESSSPEGSVLVLKFPLTQEGYRNGV